MDGPVPLPGVGPLPGRELHLSVIVPFAPHEAEGDALLEQLRTLPADCEVIVVRAEGAALPTLAEQHDGGPRWRVVTAPAGRASQMNRGAQAARGSWLWFVHADSRLHPRTLPALQAFLASRDDALGFFDLRFATDGPALTRLNALGANLRARWLGLPFGDQGLLLGAAWFKRLGGYDEQAQCGEDHLLVWHARRAGLPLRALGAPLISSARKYAREGWLNVTTTHLRLTVRQAWPEWWAMHHRPSGTIGIAKPQRTLDR